MLFSFYLFFILFIYNFFSAVFFSNSGAIDNTQSQSWQPRRRRATGNELACQRLKRGDVLTGNWTQHITHMRQALYHCAIHASSSSLLASAQLRIIGSLLAGRFPATYHRFTACWQVHSYISSVHCLQAGPLLHIIGLLLAGRSTAECHRVTDGWQVH